jgi:hypothetical protein
VRANTTSIRRDNNICRSLKALQWRTGCSNTSAVAGDDRVNPVVINMPLQMAKQRKTNAG